MKTFTCFLFCFLSLSYTGHAQQWNALGNGVNGVVRTIVSHNGDIYVGGEFTNAGGDQDADFLARWDGHQWHSVAPGLNGAVWAIDFWGDNIYVGGEFTNAGNNPNTHHIAVWNGSSWLALGTGLNNTVLTIKIYPFDPIDGVIYAGGYFDIAGSDGHFAMWGLNGQNWETLGSGVNDRVWSIAIYNDYLYIGGDFTNAGGNADVDYLAKWDGSAWSPLGNGLDGSVYTLEVHDDLLYAGGFFSGNVVGWDGNNWTNYDLHSTWGEIGDIGITGTNIYAAAWDEGVFQWNGTAWSFIFQSGNILPEDFGAVLVEGDDVYVGGRFVMNVPGTNNIARWGDPVITATQDDHFQLTSLLVYPNPTQDVIHFAVKDDFNPMHTITLRSISGEVLIKKETTESALDISHLENGVYFFQVRNSRINETVKIIKI